MSADYRSLQARFQQSTAIQSPGTPTVNSSITEVSVKLSAREITIQNEKEHDETSERIWLSHEGGQVCYGQPQNIDDLERQWNQVKQIHNQFQNNVHSPMKAKYQTRLSESQIKNVNLMKLVPHYRINLEVNDNEELTKERIDYMGAIVQKYGNIHKRSLQPPDSPANLVRVKATNSNDLKEVKRQASTQPKQKPNIADLKHCSSETNAKFMVPQTYYPYDPKYHTQQLIASEVVFLDPYATQSAGQIRLNPTKKLTKVNQPLNKMIQPGNPLRKPLASNKGSQQNVFKQVILYPAPMEQYSNQQILNQLTNPRVPKAQKSILHTPESVKKSDTLTPQKRKQKQISPRIFRGTNVMIERNGR